MLTRLKQIVPKHGEDPDFVCVRCGSDDVEFYQCDCDRCGGEGHIEYDEGGPDVWGEDCPSEVNHLVACPDCDGSGGRHWCNACAATVRAAVGHGGGGK